MISLELKPFAKYNEKMISSMTGFGLSKSVKGNSEISLKSKALTTDFRNFYKVNDLGNELENLLEMLFQNQLKEEK